MGLLCNMARSAECSALMLEHGVIALVAASLLHHQVQRVASGVGYEIQIFLLSGCISLFGHLQHGTLRRGSRNIIGHFPQTKQLNVGSFADSDL
jgi:hypothetical protein